MQCSILRCEVAKRLCSVQCCIKPCSTTRCSGMRHANANNRIQSKVTQSYIETKCKRNVSNGSEPMHCKEMQRADSNAVQSDAESGWNEVQDGARWCKMEPDGTGWNWTSLKQSPALSLSDSWHSCAGQGTGELGPWVHNLWKKNGARPGQWNRDGSWLSFNVFQCLKMLSKCLTLSMLTIAKDCLTIPLVFFDFNSFAVHWRIVWDSNTDCSRQGWLLWCWAGPQRSSNLMMESLNLNHWKSLKIVIFCSLDSLVWRQGRALCCTACPFRTKLWASVCISLVVASGG